ncbi:MAG: DUF3302 domain-containing protein [Casimicrobiaceae bacterium]
MLGFELDFWDYATFATAALAGAAGVLTYIWIAGLPGRIALARKHPEAEAVKIMGWAGLLPTVLPWVQAFIWAFKPTDIVDIRRFPEEEAKALDEEARRLKGEPSAAPGKAANTAPPPRDALAPPTPAQGGPKT